MGTQEFEMKCVLQLGLNLMTLKFKQKYDFNLVYTISACFIFKYLTIKAMSLKTDD